MRLRTQFIFSFIFFSLVLALVFALLNQWQTHQALTEMVIERDQPKLEHLAENLAWMNEQKVITELAQIPSEMWPKIIHFSVRYTFRQFGKSPEELFPFLNNPNMDLSLDMRFSIAERIQIFDAQDKHLYGAEQHQLERLSFPLMTNQGQILGQVIYFPPLALSNRIDHVLEERLLQNILFSVLFSLGFALIFSFWASNLLSRPLSRVAQGLRHLAAGEDPTTLPVPKNTGNELSQLIKDYNHLINALKQAEESRRMWVADTAHELRTPLTILQGELEALMDGIRACSNDNLQSLHAEVRHLVRLVNDLYQLSLSDAGSLEYHMGEMDLADLIEQVALQFTPLLKQKDIQLSVSKPLEAWTTGDEDRLAQLLHNLLQNSLRYTHSPGQVHIKLTSTPTTWQLTVEDSPPSVQSKDLNQLFNRFYRPQEDRNRKTGGTGLGLAIAKSIVDAHQGQIRASLSPLGGLAIHIQLPR